jgi:tRNA-dihydrouridine synthase 2
MTTLSRNISIPVTAKVRMLDSIPASVGLLRLIQQTGAAAVAVHARYYNAF